MKKFPGKVIVMRGNHDDRYEKNHTDEYGQPINNTWNYLSDDNGNQYFYQKKYPNIWYILDAGGIYHIGDYTILFIPGAYSVDKNYRIMRDYPYNPDEQLTIEEQNELFTILQNWCSLGFDIDFIVSHTAPMKLQPYFKDLFLDFLDQSTVDNSMEIWLDSIAEYCDCNIDLKQWFFGHYHADRVIGNKYTMLYHLVENLADYEKEN